MDDRKQRYLSRVKWKWKITSHFPLTLLLSLLKANHLISLASAQNSTLASSNITCEPECTQNYFCDTIKSERNVSENAHCVPCTEICKNFTSGQHVNTSSECEEKCEVWLNTQALFTTIPPEDTTFTWLLDTPSLELAPKFVLGLVGAAVTLVVLFVIRKTFSYLDSKLGPPDEEDKEPIMEAEAQLPADEPFSVSSAAIELSGEDQTTPAPSSVDALNRASYADTHQPVQLHVPPQENTNLTQSAEPIYGATTGESTG